MTLYKGCPGAKRIKEPYPEEVKCACGGVAEIWSDETNAVCKHCGRKITRELLPSCLDWCSLARECIGEKKFKDYLQAKQWKSEHYPGAGGAVDSGGKVRRRCKMWTSIKFMLRAVTHCKEGCHSRSRARP